MFQTKVVEMRKTHILCSVTFSENRTVHEIMWKNIVEGGGPQMAIWRMRVACWIFKTSNTDTRVLKYSLVFHCNSGCRNVPLC